MKKIIAVLLTLIMLFAVSVPAFAEDNLYVLLGDSISYGAGVYNSDEACYGRIVADTIGYDYANYGVNGTRSWDLINILGHEDVRNDLSRASLITLSIGGNDFLQQNLPKVASQVIVGNYKILDDVESNFKGYFEEIISIIRGLNPDALLIVQTLYNPESGLLGEFYGLAVERVNRTITGYLDSNPGAFVIVDMVPVMEGHPENVAIDTIHPSAVGNVEIAKALIKTLNEQGVTDKTEPVVNSTGIDEIPFMSYILQFFVKLFYRLFSFLG